MRGGVREALRAGVVAIAAEPARIVPRFLAVPDGAFVWTRDEDGWYWLGRMGCSKGPGPLEHLPHARVAQWLERPFAEDEVPAGVAATFARGGRNFQRTHGAPTERRTAELWAAAT